VLFGVDTGQLCSPEELWATQGSVESAKLVKAFDGPIVSWQVVGDVAYVVAANGVLYDVWRTDGTAGGTTLVKDGFSLESTTPTAVLDTALYLAAAHSDTGGQSHLWRVDSSGARPLAVTGGEFRTLQAYQNALYVSVGYKIWRLPSGSDTAVPFKPSQLSVDVPQMHTVGERLYLLQLEGSGAERRETWWRYDGASDVLDRIGVWSRVIGLTHLGDSDYFAGFPLGSRFTGGELLRLPLASTTPTSVSPQFGAGGPNAIGAIATDSEQLYLLVNPPIIDYTGPTDLWISDGSAGGTRRFTSLVTSYTDLRYEMCPCVTAAGNQVFFDRQAAQTGVELWRAAESTDLEYLPLITHR
jgi:ELWxxDGT repeat protein